MKVSVGIGIQDFGKIRDRNSFYVDKTNFIKDWWSSDDDVTLITRPRRFGKTLLMSTVNYFFSIDHKEDSHIFEGLNIWNDEKYRQIQGTYPVIFLTFANVKETTFEQTVQQIKYILTSLIDQHIWQSNLADQLSDQDKKYFRQISPDMDDVTAKTVLSRLSETLYRYYGKKTIILMDEYDTPMQEAYVNGFWNELVSFIRGMFNATFKTNLYLERAIMTGITRISEESIFSDLNNLKVITTTSTRYATSFGFTEKEVFESMKIYGYSNLKDVKRWYDGFTFGNIPDIYNPWSIINFLDEGKLRPYWANSSSNSLAGKLIQKGDRSVKISFESLLKGETISTLIDEEIVFDQLNGSENAIWSLLLASGYLKVNDIRDEIYDLSLTNYEVKKMFQKIVLGWFDQAEGAYNDFVKALLDGDLERMNVYMNRVVLSSFSSFDVGTSVFDRPEKRNEEADQEELLQKEDRKLIETERFYHGFVLGLLAQLSEEYEITSNQESGLGRYDVMICPKNGKGNAFILEFKAMNVLKGEKQLEDVVATAHKQIEERQYEASLLERGIKKENIMKYGFAFRGKHVLIG